MYESARRLSAPIEPKGNDLLQGYLLPSPGRNTIPLYSSHHPVTFDQLLTTDAGQAADMGFVETALLGNLIAEAPLTGAIGAGRTSVPWASRFGEAIREA
jgi:hypothetical protein